jgi:ferrous iron transport protein A
VLKPLSELRSGERGIVRELQGGRRLGARLAGLGLAPGTLVRVVHNYGRGPLTIAVLHTRVALGIGQAARVLVETTEGGL